MRFRFTVTQLRISILALNGLLALGVPAFAAYHYLGMGKQPEAPNRVNKIHPPGTFVYVDSGGPTGKNPRADVSGMVAIIMPPPPAKPSDTTIEPTKVDKGPEATEAQNPADYLPGPLAAEPHNYEYSGFICREDPTRTQVWLQKKAPGGLPGGALGGGAMGSSRASTKIKSTTAASRTKRPAVKGMAQPSDRIQLVVSQREYSSDELGLHFWIHSADSERMVYWMHEDVDKPKKTLYALKYVSGSQYVDGHKDKPALGPPEKTAEEIAAQDAEKAVPKWRTYNTKVVEDTTETDYQKIFLGQKRLKDSAIFSDDAKAHIIGGSPKAHDAAAPASDPASSKITPSKGPGGGPRQPTADELKQIKDGIKGIPKKDQDEILKAMRGGK